MLDCVTFDSTNWGLGKYTLLAYVLRQLGVGGKANRAPRPQERLGSSLPPPPPGAGGYGGPSSMSPSRRSQNFDWAPRRIHSFGLLFRFPLRNLTPTEHLANSGVSMEGKIIWTPLYGALGEFCREPFALLVTHQELPPSSGDSGVALPRPAALAATAPVPAAAAALQPGHGQGQSPGRAQKPPPFLLKTQLFNFLVNMGDFCL